MFNLRFVILFITVLGSCVTYLTRTAITVALVSMVKNESAVQVEKQPINDSIVNISLSANTLHDCSPAPEDASVTQWLNELGSREYDYSPTLQGFLQSAFFATYILFQVPAGTYAKKFGGKWFMVVSLTGSTVISLVSPFITDFTWLFLASRALLGVFQSVWFPTSFVILMNWMPLADQTFALAAHTAGSTFGAIITFATSGYIVAYLNGWPSLFFVYGFTCLTVLIITIAFVTSNPSDHPLMSPRELNLIMDNSQRRNTLRKDASELVVCTENNNQLRRVSVISRKLNEDDEEEDEDDLSVQPPIPWSLIFKNRPFLVTLFFKLTNGCIFMVLYTEIPEYLKMMFHEDAEHNGVVNGIIQACFATSQLLIGYLSERVIERNFLSRTSTRKTCGAIAGFSQALCLALLPFISNLDLIHVTLCLVGFFLGFSAGAEYSLPGEMSKNFGAELYAILNITSVTTGIIVPNIISLTLNMFPADHKEVAWNLIFYSFALFNLISTTLFVLFVRAERQPFDSITLSTKKPFLSSVSTASSIPSET